MSNSMGYNPTNLNQESAAATSETNQTADILTPNQTLGQYNSTQHHHGNIHTSSNPDLDPAPVPAQAPVPAPAPAPPTMLQRHSPSYRYQECLKNHAAPTGGNVLDGCCEFMPDGDENTPDELKCAVCGCHRNFHRKVPKGGSQSRTSLGHHIPTPMHQIDTNNIFYTTTTHAQPPPLPLIPAHQQPRFPQSSSRGPTMMAFGGDGRVPAESSRSSEDLNIFHPNADTQVHIHQHTVSTSRKRFRTKFTHQQKEMMNEFAERIGWRIQKQDEQEVERFCNEVGVKRQVFKVWMHNNKQAMKKKQM
ncbi:hypothetical protein LIER_31815 [Lithospermum erythrorhizon]|uniref:ZF-HD dimerization-type domain-containing protein n=1 Tax=Lithospermum erythrorhizon TaxID=34254 RepID=A0AAV3RVV8_LITER